jgi:hypothetical protein
MGVFVEDVPAADLRRGDRIWVGGEGWRALTRVRRLRSVVWIGEAPGPAVEFRWRLRGETHVQHVKPFDIITIKYRG